MDRRILDNIFLLIGVILIQVLICNHIAIFGVAIAFVYIYVILRLPMNTSVNWVLTWAFLAGLIVDIFSDTPGVNALAATLIAMFRKPMLFAYIPKDDRTKNIMPSLQSLGFNVYGKYLFTASLVYCLLAFTIEYFNFADVKEIVIMTLSSAALTFLVIIGIDSLVSSKREKSI